jgi:hypothetical protein
MVPLWHCPCREKARNEVNIDHIVFLAQHAHIQTLSTNAASLNGMTVILSKNISL